MAAGRDTLHLSHMQTKNVTEGLKGYTKQRTLGKGSYGTASLCTRLADEKLCVIKAINLVNLSEKDRDNAEKEVRILQKVDHPNAIRYFDSFTVDGILCIVTEYADGGDLSNVISHHRRHKDSIREDMVLSWAVQLVLALKCLHENKILHRDLKPANIFLTSKQVIKLGDFGVSTVLQATMNFAETFCGTPYYLSPEVCEEKPYNNKADVWAMGCCLYETMALHRPFEANNILALADKICKGSYRPLPVMYSQDLRDFVDKLLSLQAVVRPNVHRILKQPLMRRAMMLLSSDLLEAEKYQRVLRTHNLQDLRPKEGRHGQFAESERAMHDFVSRDRSRLEEDEFTMLSSSHLTTTSTASHPPVVSSAEKEKDKDYGEPDGLYGAMHESISFALEGKDEKEEDIEDEGCVFGEYLRSGLPVEQGRGSPPP